MSNVLWSIGFILIIFYYIIQIIINVKEYIYVYRKRNKRFRM